jgi:integrase
VLSPDEVARMIEAAPNLLHRTILMVLYATGIRRTEASLLKVSDVCFRNSTWLVGRHPVVRPGPRRRKLNRLRGRIVKTCER